MVMVGLGLTWGVACTSAPAEERSRAEVPRAADTSTTSPTTASTTASTTAAPTTVPPEPTLEPLLIDPELSIRDQVEAAYLHHWDILLDAFATGEPSNLRLVYTGGALEFRLDELNGFVERGERMGGHVDHNYEITVQNDEFVILVDGYRTHLFLTDPEGEPISEPTGHEALHEYHFIKDNEQWLIEHLIRYRLPESSD